MTNSLTLPNTIMMQAINNDPHLLSPHSKRQYKSNLRDFEAYRAGRDMTKTLVEAYAAELQREGLAPATINQKLATIRWWARKIVDLAFDYAPDQAEIISKQAARVLTVEDVKGTRDKKGRHIPQSELIALLKACVRDKTKSGKRDAALIALAWSTGMRRDEIAGLKLSDIVLTEYGAKIKVIGKGNKFRPIPIMDGGLKALQSWLLIRGDQPGYVFCRIYKNDNLPKRFGHPLSGEALRKILDARIMEANIQPMTWHDFRRTFAGNLLDDKADIRTVQTLMGHSDPKTTAEYDRRGERVKVAALKSLYIPTIGE